MEKKKKIIVCCIITLLFIAPIIVLAAIYSSTERKNKFIPAEAEIEILESGAENPKGSKLTNEYTFTKNTDDDNYSVAKPVQIIDKRSNSGEDLRVCLVPMWYDSEGDVCGGIDGVTDISDIKLDETEKKLVYYTGAGTSRTPIITLYLSSGYASNWEYKSDGCFYYSGNVADDNSTLLLVERVEITKSVYDATEGYELRLDVLADALQTNGDAYSNRDWDKYEP